MNISSKTYDVLKWISRLVLPAIGSLYFGLSEIWSLPYATEVVGTITVVVAFSNSLLGISQQKFNKENVTDVIPLVGVLNIVPEADDVKTAQIVFNDTEIVKKLAEDPTGNIALRVVSK